MNSQQQKELETKLWDAATNLRSASGLKSNEYSTPILGIVFLRFAETIYARHEADIQTTFAELQNSRKYQGEPIKYTAISKCGFYLPDKARYDYLLQGKYKTSENQQTTKDALKEAMREIELDNEMPDTLPIDEYDKLTSESIDDLIKQFSEIPLTATMDVFGKIYEFFLGKFALSEGQKGGEFFTPTPVVELMVEIIEPKGGKLLDPACGSGGMFVHSAQYVKRHYPAQASNFAVDGFEKSKETSRLARMNTKINGVRSTIVNVNTFEYAKSLANQYDYVLANPPFNVKDIKTMTVETKEHFNAYGLPKNKGKSKGEEVIPNANYLWINLFASALKANGRAGLVMPNSASDARESEYEIRKRLIEEGMIEAMLTLSSNMFSTVTLPATLWFFEKSNTEKAEGSETPTKEINVLFVDARNIFTQLPRKQRTFTNEQIQNIATIFRLHRGENHRLTELLATYQIQADQYAALATAKEQALESANQALQTLIKNQPKDLFGKEQTKTDKEVSKQQKVVDALQKELSELQKQHAYFLAQQQWLNDRFPDGTYRDVVGLCKSANLAEIAEQDYSLNPGRYVGVVIEDDGTTAEEFQTQIEQWNTELTTLNQQAHVLENTIAENLKKLFPQQKNNNEQ